MPFRGTRRFELIRKLGEGGMGLVYEAHDNERDMRVALKTLRELDASSLYRFKREFRALADVSHPNVIGLYELVSEGDEVFFTMELVEGVDFITWARPDGWRAPTSVDPGSSTATVKVEGRKLEAPVEQSPGALPEVRPPFESLAQPARLRPALIQLAQALDALHGAGIVHRDLKPSNVRVTPRGRVVLMDFGIAAETSTADISEDAAGTPQFMAPEQATSDAPTAAADWYSFGVILYLAITGRLPFTGDSEAVLMAKQSWLPARPSQLADGVPGDLEALCYALLARDPSVRPDGHEVLARLGATGDAPRTESPESSRALFVGREHELAELHAAFDTARAGAMVGVFLRGPSGMGKSTLVRRFLYEVEAHREQPILLKGRCHERESLPYKAFDGVIDHLSHLLVKLPPERVLALLPDDADLLPRLFPVLRRVPGVQPAQPSAGSDPQELRNRAFAALSELLRRLASEHPLVVYIDDLQWADRDSLHLLVELLRDPDAPHLLFLASMRSENLSGDPALGRALGAVAARHSCIEIDLAPLQPGEQRALVSRLLGDSATAEQLADPFWAESAGSPLFLSELVRYARARGGALPAGERPRLEDVLYQRIEQLPATARALLEGVAVAGEPMSLEVLGDAVALTADERERALAVLRVASLVRVARHGREPWLATYHDRVRETLTARLSDSARSALHRHLATVLERSGEASVDALARHWQAAGDRIQAAAYLVKAARAAADKLAFDRAAELYQAALECDAHDADLARQLHRERAEALERAGRCFEAAGAYHEATAGAAADEAVELQRLQADNLLRAGHVEAGLGVLGALMGQLGVRIAPTRRRAVASLIIQRSRITLRGLGYRSRAADEVPAKELSRLDSLYAASTALGMIDHIRAADVQTRHLLGALKWGEERTVCRALAIEVVFRASFGGAQMRQAEALSREVQVKAQQLGEPALLGAAGLALGATYVFSGRYRAAAQAFGEAERAFGAGLGSHWERVTARFFVVTSRMIMGDFAEAARATTRIVEEADRRNDLYTRSLFKTQPIVWQNLREDNPEEAGRQVATALDGWPPGSFYTAHYLALVARAIVFLYSGQYAEALELIRAGYPEVQRAQLARLPWVIADLQRQWLAAAFATGANDDLARTLKVFGKLRAPPADGFVAFYEGGLAAREGRRERAQERLVQSIRSFEAADMAQMVAAVRFRLAELLPNREGARLAALATDWMAGQGVRNPTRMFDALAPRL